MTTFQELELGKRGDPITSDWLNRGLIVLNRQRPAAVANQVIGRPVLVGEEAEQVSQVRAFRFVAPADDYLSCRVFETEAVVNVASPPHLRRSLWDGESKWHFRLDARVLYFYGEPYWRFPQTDRRVARILDTDPVQEFVEILEPDYRQHVMSDETVIPVIILAAKVGPDALGLTAPINREGEWIDEPVVWADMNWEGRKWEMAPNELIPVPEPEP